MQIKINHWQYVIDGVNPNDYCVQIGNNVYEMNAQADQPNGVCIYLGEASELTLDIDRTPVNMIPLGIVCQIAKLSNFRQWKCPDCDAVIDYDYEHMAEVGGPVCGDCDCDMKLVK